MRIQFTILRWLTKAADLSYKPIILWKMEYLAATMIQSDQKSIASELFGFEKLFLRHTVLQKLLFLDIALA